MTEELTGRLAQLEEAVRRAGDAITRLRDENQRLKRQVEQFEEQRRQSLSQIDAILKDIAKLDVG
jgi:CII-binding regulator of phage lambda lysogenization HflD